MVISQPVVIPHPQHNISCHSISQNALKVLHDLNKAGFEAYLVGGGVRDLLLGLHPKDFDIVTDARPEQVRKLFHNCILIGRRFRLAHVRFGREIVEVATFRAGVEHDSEKCKRSVDGMILCDNAYGTIEKDVWRRDFTVNALYLRFKDFSIVDYTGGMKDLQHKTIRMIGEPIERYREDPVRMLRALRLAAKLGFKIEKNTAISITKLGPLIANISPARLFEEVLKWFRSGNSLEIFQLLQKYKLFVILFGSVAILLPDKNNKNVTAMLHHGFANSDQRIVAGKPINPAFLFAVLLWWPLQEQIKYLRKRNADINEVVLLQQAIQQVLREQKRHILLPQKLVFMIKDIWVMQHYLVQKKRRKIYYLLAHPKFRAAYDFLLLRAQAGESVKEFAKWWTLIQEVSETERQKLIEKYTGET